MEPASEESSQDLLKCGETASIFFQKPSTSLDPARYEEFWKKLKPASYASTLITRLIAVYTGEDKHVQLYDKVKALVSNNLGPVPDVLRQETDVATSQQQQNVLVTLFFVGTFFPFMLSNVNLKVSLGRLSNIRGKLNAALPGSPDVQFIIELEKIFSQPATYQALEGVKYAILQCVHLETTNKLPDYSRISAKSMAVSLLQGLVRSRLHQNAESSNYVFEQILQLLQHPSVSESLLLPLLHMLRTFLSTTSFPPLAMLPRIIQVVTPYYIWPRPYSDSAREVIEVASIELKAPFTAFRTTLMEENPALIPGMAALPGSSASDPTGGMHSTPKERNVWLLFDKEMTRAKSLHEILKQHVATQTPNVELQLRFLATVFSTVLKVKVDSLGLEYATPEQIHLYYGAAVTVLEHSLTLPEDKATEHYSRELASLHKKILSEIGSAQQHKAPKPSKLPPLNFISKVVGFSVKDYSIDNSAHTRHHFPKRESFDYLLDILNNQALELAHPGEQPPIVKIGIIGDDDTIHNVATGFLVLSSVRPDLIEKLDVRFYFIPVGNSDLGNWITSLDPWYGRQAILMSRAIQGLCPSPTTDGGAPGSGGASSSSVSSSGASGRSQSMRFDALSLGNNFIDLIEEQSKLLSPSSILHSELEYMFREAKQPLNLNIFRAECVLPDNSTVTLPFFARASIGLPAAIENFKKINDLSSNLTEAEITAHKNFKWNPPTVSLKYIQMNPLSVPRAIGQQDARVYTTITLAALPVAGDRANFINPNPTQPWLELMLLEDKKKKATSREDVRTYHVSQVELGGPEPFDICLDGISYGPVTKVKFTAATHADKDAIYRLPLMTFFPTEGLH